MEYIDREKIISKTCSNCTRQIDLECQYEKPCEHLIAAFLNEDSADVAPVVHGRWKYKEEWGKLLTNSCSVCGQILTTKRGEEMNYCPNCGAKMDAET